jgi:hypothetical protein
MTTAATPHTPPRRDDLIFADDGGATPDVVRGEGGTDTCPADEVDVVVTCEL